eukprot:SAG25_NODE_443_length_7964_cov_171.205722_1_plen_57_part_00
MNTIYLMLITFLKRRGSSIAVDQPAQQQRHRTILVHSRKSIEFSRVNGGDSRVNAN